MNFMTIILSVFAVLCALISPTSTAPILPRDVYVPPIMYPRQGTVWYTGQTHNVTWDASNPPQRITNPIGKIYLRHDGRTGHLLAEGFNIKDGRHEVRVPDDASPGRYQIVLFGDSGNFSPDFEIKRGNKHW